MHLSTSRRFSLIAGIIALISLLPLAVFAGGGGVISRTGTRVWGQPDFTSSNYGTSATHVDSPQGIAFDTTGNLYAADFYNNRVLRFPVADGVVATTADLVWGQATFTTKNSGTSATSLSYPFGISFDTAGNMYVVDRDNSRVLRYPISNGVIATTADQVWGQPNFATNTYGTSATTLTYPSSISFDAAGNLYVTDSGNNRVVRYPISNGVIATTADRVWGQPDFTSAAAGSAPPVCTLHAA